MIIRNTFETLTLLTMMSQLVVDLQLLSQARNRVSRGRGCSPLLQFIWNNVRVRLKDVLLHEPKMVRVRNERAYFFLKAKHHQFLFCTHPTLLGKRAREVRKRPFSFLRSQSSFEVLTFYVNLFDAQCDNPLDWSLCSTIVRKMRSFFLFARS